MVAVVSGAVLWLLWCGCCGVAAVVVWGAVLWLLWSVLLAVLSGGCCAATSLASTRLGPMGACKTRA